MKDMKDVLSHWENYRCQLSNLIVEVAQDISDEHFNNSSDALTLRCLYSELYTAYSNVKFTIRILNATDYELHKENIGEVDDL